MKNVINTKDFWPINQKQAREICRDIEDTYGPCSSVSRLFVNSYEYPYLSECEIGVIDMNDLGLVGGKDTFKDVIEKSLEMGYLKVSPHDVLNYIEKLWPLKFGSMTAIMCIMDEVVDGDGFNGVFYLQPDNFGFLCKLGFFTIDKSRTLSQTAKFLTKKLIQT